MCVIRALASDIKVYKRSHLVRSISNNMTEGPSSATSRGFDTNHLPNDSRGGDNGGGTYTSSQRNPSMDDYEQIFGPSARDIKQDPMRHKRHQRWHLPDVLKGPNPYLTDRIDGLITDTTNSPFTTVILPYVYLEHPDAKIKWNVWAFDEGMASRVPYESAARVLTQTHKSFAGYTVRHGLAVTLEHNFMMSPEGRVNFQNQLKQLVGSIQYTNDYDVHVALIMAPSYASTVDEKYYARDKNVWQRCREYVDLFGIMQKNGNAMDILIEEAKATLRSWGSQEPNFLLTNSKLTMQMTMTPEQTSYITYGPDGAKRLKNGPNISNYRGLNIVNSRSFSTEEGARPRDVLNRRVRVAEYYLVKGVTQGEKGYIEMYDQSKDQMFKISFADLYKRSQLPGEDEDGKANWKKAAQTPYQGMPVAKFAGHFKSYKELVNDYHYDYLKMAKNIDHTYVGGLAVLPKNGLIQPLDAYRFGRRFDDFDDQQTYPFSSPTITSKNFACEMTNEILAEFLIKPTNEDNLENIVRNTICPIFGIDNAFAQLMKIPDILKSRLVLYLAYNLLSGQEKTEQGDNEKTQLGDIVFQEKKEPLSEFAAKLTNQQNYDEFNFDQIVDEQVFQQFGTTTLNEKSNKIVKTSWTMKDPHPRSFVIRLNHALNFALQSMCNKNVHSIFEISAHFFNNTLLDGLQFSQIDGDNDPDPSEVEARDKARAKLDIHNSKYFAETYEEPEGDNTKTDSGTNWDQHVDGWDFVIVRPNIEHNMLGVVMGRGGKDELGATFWGQTELSCYDDGMHGKWGMSYKYHERAMVLNEKNLIKCWDVAFNGYNGGMDDTHVDWKREDNNDFQEKTTNLSEPYSGDSMIIMRFRHIPGKHWPNPILLSHEGPIAQEKGNVPIDPENIHSIFDWKMAVFSADAAESSESTAQWNGIRFMKYAENSNFPDFARLHRQRKPAGYNAQESLTETTSLAFQGTSRVNYMDQHTEESTKGAGHLGQSYVGVASVREGKGLFWSPGASSMMKMF